jgi:hypothetical protein
MPMMNRTLIVALCITMASTLVVHDVAQAQMLPPGASQFSPPPPAPLPPPKIEVPVVPQMDAPPSQPAVQPSGRGSFGERINTCLDQAAASGLGPGERAEYSRSCANR